MSQSTVQDPASAPLKKQILYILAFKDEAVIKVGLAIDPVWLCLLEPELWLFLRMQQSLERTYAKVAF